MGRWQPTRRVAWHRLGVLKNLSLQCGRVRAEQSRERRVLAQRRERVDHLRYVCRRVDIGVEDVLPWTSGPRARLELRQVQVALGERAEAAVQRACDVAHSEDE